MRTGPLAPFFLPVGRAMPSPASAPGRSAADDQHFQQQLASGCTFIPLTRCWPADLETPLSTWLKVGATSSHGVLLESVEGGERLGRWSFVVSDPLWILTSRGEHSERRWRDGRCETGECDGEGLLAVPLTVADGKILVGD